jgi:hypothetical protein
MNIWDQKQLSFGFVSTRFAGTDGVSLEAQKWVDVLTTNGCKVYYLAGKLDRNETISHLSPKAFSYMKISRRSRTLSSLKRGEQRRLASL